MENNEKIYELISSTPFEELSESEKKMVLSTMSENDYREVYNLELRFKNSNTSSVKDAWVVNPKIKLELKKKFRLYQTQKDKAYLHLPQFIYYKIPVYQFALVLLFLFIINFYFQKQHVNIQIPNSPKVVYNTIVDTIYIEKEKLVGLKYSYLKKSKPQYKVDSITPNIFLNETIPQITYLDSNYKLGSSLKEDSILKTFITKVQ